MKPDVRASTRFTSSSSHQTAGELVLCYYLLVAKQLSLVRFSRKRIIRTATNIKNKSEIKIDIKRKTKNITLPEQLKNVIDNLINCGYPQQTNTRPLIFLVWYRLFNKL